MGLFLKLDIGIDKFARLAFQLKISFSQLLSALQNPLIQLPIDHTQFGQSVFQSTGGQPGNQCNDKEGSQANWAIRRHRCRYRNRNMDRGNDRGHHKT